MNVTDYTYLMNKPDAITEKQADALGSVLNEFPYFQSARALRLKGLYDQNSFKYNYALKVAAAHTTDRSVLFDFITSETFTSIQSEYYDQKLKDLLNITVFDSEIVLAEEKKKLAEVRIDPIEKSILDSIKEATTVTFEKPSIIEEPKAEPVIEQSILDSFKEVTTITFEEPQKIEEIKIEPVSELSILDSFKEVTTATFEEPQKIEEIKTELLSEQSILDSFKEVTTATFEEPQKIEEFKVEPISESSILDSFKEVTTATFDEPIKVDEPKVDPIVDPIIETPVKIATSTFFDETVDDEIPEVQIDTIEKPILNSIKEASTVVFEESKEIEEPKEVEVSETVKTAEENLEIGKPLDFSVNEKHSFQEWLQLARTEPIDRTEEAPKAPEEVKQIEKTVESKTVESKAVVEVIDEEKKKKAEIIDKFIETNPKISPIKQVAINTTVQFDINQEDNSYLMTETLARVYLEQKKYTKAIQAYEILILKYPEKISFFADRISDIKILQQNNNNN
ncbi:tetratricopeptide repeat protein [uncultured Flavobacterium sp.]|uniref:tetratricopeptide repeat protein n=1 Tax=uncultured Flavobacterium sp. TaxID=165435 RepID=UPI00292D6142|nr:tetratricopeptide repeat protein [uncultured Flavobacterium sp.]